ncbi:MAG: DUF1294 domain-containing protein [Planctomycetaceae bacterium]
MKTLQKLWTGVALVWLTICVVVSVMTLASSTFAPGIVATVYVWTTSILSAAAFGLYGYDKLRAERDKSRISEKSLHLVALCGGWPGAVMGQQYFRHKTLKLTFRAMLAAIVLLHWTAAGIWFWLSRTPPAAS